MTFSSAAMNWDDGVGHVDDQGAPPQRRRGGGESQHQPGHHLPPARLVMAEVLLDDEAQPHPAQDDHQHSRGDGPDRRPGGLDHGIQVGEFRGVPVRMSPIPLPPRTRRCPSRWLRSTTPHRVPWTPWITHLAPALAQRSGSRAPSTLSHRPLGWWTGTRAWKTWSSPPPVTGDGHHHQESLLRVEFRLPVQDRVLEGVLPALGEFLLAAPHPVGVGDPLAGVGVAQGVVEHVDPAAEDGAGDELAVLLALHHLPVAVDQGQVVAVGGWGLGQGDAAGGTWPRWPPAAAPPPAASAGV